MTDKVIVSIKGVQHEYGDDGITEMITTGNYYFRNGKHYILYDEMIPDTGEQMSNTLKMTPSRIDLIKHGSHSAHMVFEANTKNMVVYRTPYGMMEVCFNTFSVELEETEKISALRRSMLWKSTKVLFLIVPSRSMFVRKNIDFPVFG